MDNIKYTVGVQVNQKEDGRFYFNILTDDSVDMEMIRSILAGGLMLTILSEKTPEAQSKAMMDIINYMQREFVSIDSFSDIGGPAVPKE